MPKSIITNMRHSSIEVNFLQGPSFLNTYPSSQEIRIIIGELVTKSALGGIKKILAIDKSNDSFFRGFRRHGYPLKNNTPPEALRLVRRGADAEPIIDHIAFTFKHNLKASNGVKFNAILHAIVI